MQVRDSPFPASVLTGSSTSPVQKQCTVRNWAKRWISEAQSNPENVASANAFCVKLWGLFLVASDWCFLIFCFLQHFSFTSDPGPLRGEGILLQAKCQDQTPVSSYRPCQARLCYWSLHRSAWGFITLKQNFLLNFQDRNCFFHFETGLAVCRRNFTISV
jgi:hypothetical protein